MVHPDRYFNDNTWYFKESEIVVPGFAEGRKREVGRGKEKVIRRVKAK